jgi:hypothetical protein
MIKHAINVMFDSIGDDNPHVIAKGTVGFIASAIPLLVSRLDAIHDYLQVAALGCGLVISVLTIVSLSLTIERKIRIRIHESKSGRIIGSGSETNRD